ncbi:MAG: hypothetical protein QOH46_4173 [Solirubrobacteraceae bacterium]|nr:hypothetical protein [Solirubrobacteraceae bacterium]
MKDLEFLAALHQLVRPPRYLEIGVGDGERLALARRRAIGVAPTSRYDVKNGVRLYRQPPEAYFARKHPLRHFEGRPPVLTLIAPGQDGLRWFAAAEPLMRWHGVVVMDGATGFDPGDRVVVPVATEPALVVVLGLLPKGERAGPGPVHEKRLAPGAVLDSSLWRIVRNARSQRAQRDQGVAELHAAYRRDLAGLSGFVRRLRRA